MKNKKMEKSLRGWFPQEPLTKNFAANTSPAPKTKAELDKKLVKDGRIINLVIVITFLGANFALIQPYYNYQVSTTLTALILSLFAVTLATNNLLLYFRYRKQLQTRC